jgi:hypothetical protein
MTSFPWLRLRHGLLEKPEKVFSVSLCLGGELFFDRRGTR